MIARSGTEEREREGGLILAPAPQREHALTPYLVAFFIGRLQR